MGFDRVGNRGWARVERGRWKVGESRERGKGVEERKRGDRRG